MPEMNIDVSELANGIILFAAVVGGVAVLWQKLILPGLERVIKEVVAPLIPQLIFEATARIEAHLNDVTVKQDEHNKKLDCLDGKLSGHVAWAAELVEHNKLEDPTET